MITTDKHVNYKMLYDKITSSIISRTLTFPSPRGFRAQVRCTIVDCTNTRIDFEADTALTHTMPPSVGPTHIQEIGPKHRAYVTW